MLYRGRREKRVRDNEDLIKVSKGRPPPVATPWGERGKKNEREEREGAAASFLFDWGSGKGEKVGGIRLWAQKTGIRYVPHEEDQKELEVDQERKQKGSEKRF